MARSWNTTKFRKLIGGIKVTIEEKQQNLCLINDAITINNNNLDFIEIDNEVFAKSYPESLNLVNDYYDSLYNAQINKLKTKDKKNNIRIVHKIKMDVESQKKVTLMLFVPYILEKNISHNELGITIIELASLINNYKVLISNLATIKDLGKEDQKYCISKLFYEELMINGLEFDELSIKYNMTEYSINKYINYLSEIDIDSYVELKKYLEEKQQLKAVFLRGLISKIGDYCLNRIKVDTKLGEVTIPFTILDYYSITDHPLKDIVCFVNNHRNFDVNNKEENLKKNLVREMFQNQVNVGQNVTKEFIINSNLSAGKNDNVIKINEEICDEIFAFFEQENIPKGKLLIEIAFRRYACNYPILPLKLIENKKINQEEKVVKPLVKTLTKEINNQ